MHFFVCINSEGVNCTVVFRLYRGGGGEGVASRAIEMSVSI